MLAFQPVFVEQAHSSVEYWSGIPTQHTATQTIKDSFGIQCGNGYFAFTP